MKNIFVILIVSVGLSTQMFAQTGPPEPPMGKRWVMNPDFSDEFNGTELDAAKWFDYHPKWKGREPGIFLPSQVSVKDGYLQIKGEKLKKDTIVKAYGRELVYNIAGGAVVSKASAFLGYYECRMKAAATTMSSTFWFSTVKNYEGPEGCDRYGLEWDIQECIGRSGDFAGNFFANGMNSNGHYWYTDCNKTKHDLKASSVKISNTELASKDFHTYGGWWRDEKSASYYYDNRAPKHIKFYDKKTDKPFDQPMRMRLVSETYPFPWIALPTDEELADPTKNTVYYDWVRGYKLVDVNDDNVNQDYETNIKIYNESVYFPVLETQLKGSENKTVKIPFSYKANQKRKIEIMVFETTDRTKIKWGRKVNTKIIDVLPGYGNMQVAVDLSKNYSKSIIYRVQVKMFPTDWDKKSKENLDESSMFFTIQ